MSALTDRLDLLASRLDGFAGGLQVDAKRAAIARTDAEMSSPGFWDDQERARVTIVELKALKGVIEPYDSLRRGIPAARELLELAEGDGDEAAVAELAAEVERLEGDLDRLEVRLALDGPYDSSDVYLSIQAGAGGTDACDWAAMLLRMYSTYCQEAGYQVAVHDVQENMEAGIRSATLRISGEMAYGFLKSEMGTHRLVRISPFNSSGTRETSFAAVEVTPELPDNEVNIEDINDKEFKIDTFRAGGAGGQHVNKTDSAVRITHLPTGLVSACQTERSQIQNRLHAWKMMAAKLRQLEESKRLKELQDLSGERGTIGWGHQIRSYVLQPYQLIKDLRTSHEDSQVDQVLAGHRLQPFIDAYLRWRLAGAKGR